MPHEFYDPLHHFRITKPDQWQFQEPRWSPMVQLRNRAGYETEWLRWASEPFVCFTKEHADETQAYPTVQVSARASGGVPPSATAKLLLEEQIELLRSTYADFELVSATPDRIIAGFRANAIRATFSFADEARQYRVLSRSVTIWTPTASFTIGISTSTDPRFYDEDELDAILASVRIGEP
jgi:hypothetical protein